MIKTLSPRGGFGLGDTWPWRVAAPALGSHQMRPLSTAPITSKGQDHASSVGKHPRDAPSRHPTRWTWEKGQLLPIHQPVVGIGAGDGSPLAAAFDFRVLGRAWGAQGLLSPAAAPAPVPDSRGTGRVSPSTPSACSPSRCPPGHSDFWDSVGSTCSAQKPIWDFGRTWGSSEEGQGHSPTAFPWLRAASWEDAGVGKS